MILLRKLSIILAIVMLFAITRGNAQGTPKNSMPSSNTSVAKGDTLVHRVTIKGAITNVEESRSFQVIVDSSYLQLVSYVMGAGIPVSYNKVGRVASPSNLPKTAIPKKGSFSIVCKDLKPGTYIVVVQWASLRPQHLAILQKNGQALQIQVTKDTGHIIDVGDVSIPESMNR
jgi:preprotein translocase subunit YajC